MVLVCSGGWGFAAGSAKEEREYAAAAAAFQDGLWSRAEMGFARFSASYPASAHGGEAALLRAQAEIKQGKLTDALARLADPKLVSGAGPLADDVLYWTGEARFQGGDFSGAAEDWLALDQKFPESSLRLEAVIGAASAFGKLARWGQIISLLEAPGGVFPRAVQMDLGSERVAQGQLLLAQAKCERGDFAGAAALLEPLLESRALTPDLERQGALLLYQVQTKAGQPDAALGSTSHLLRVARIKKNDDWRAEARELRAAALERLGRTADALAEYQENLTNAPVARQREATLKIAGLAIAQQQFSNAVPMLEAFLAGDPDSPAADTVLLTLGELRMKEAVAPRSEGVRTNLLLEARGYFDRMIATQTNSPLIGVAHLDRGWCFWLAGAVSESSPDFQAAAQLLPSSDAQAVARFKLGDVRFAQKDYAGALKDYRAVLEKLPRDSGTAAALGDAAGYQLLRASLELNDPEGARTAFERICQRNPASSLVPGSSLLYGESLANPAEARALFERLSPLLSGPEWSPQVALAIARTYERERSWPFAVNHYENWLVSFPTNALVPQVSYALAQAAFQAGQETNAFQRFTNFVAQFPGSDLAPLAQWWVADHFFRLPDYVGAERNYKFVFENWPASPLASPARLMAGRAAVARSDYNGAIRDYFTVLEQDTNCPIDLRVQATFAESAALMAAESADTNQSQAGFQKAADLLSQICQVYATNELGALAWGEIGKCALQMSDVDAATNAYAQVFQSPFAGISARSQALVGYGIALEKKAARADGDERRMLLARARDSYLDVFYGNLLRAGEVPDDFWVKKAGLQALPLIGAPGASRPEEVDPFLDHLEKLFPQSRESLEKKRAAYHAEKK